MLAGVIPFVFLCALFVFRSIRCSIFAKTEKEVTRVKGRDTTDRSSSTDLCVAKVKKCIWVKLSSQQQMAKRHVCAVYIM